MNLRGLCLVACLFLTAMCALGRPKIKSVTKDSFDVVGHLDLGGSAITGIVTTYHFSRRYVYAECAADHTVTVVDVTESDRPKRISSVTGTGSLLTAAGDVALVSSEPTSPSVALKTISIVDFSDKTNPKVIRQFAGVTSLASDNQRNLVFLTNAEGLWILHRNQPVDPEIEERYAHDVVYNH